MFHRTRKLDDEGENKMSSLATPAEQGVAVKTGGKAKFVIGALLILGAIAYVTISSFQTNAIYYLNLKELNAQRGSLINQPVRINAPLDKSSTQFDDKTLILKFNLKEDNLILPVVYKGVKPDTFEQGESVVAEGKLGQDGTFYASTILVKCPSKYESEVPK
jgi:cytochrome c-type biogenesis protein CcmE